MTSHSDRSQSGLGRDWSALEIQTSPLPLSDEDCCDKPKVKPFAKNFTIFNNDDKVHHGQVKM